MKRKLAQRRAIAMTVAGSDSGGGAGIQADLKTFHSLGVHGTVAITCLTAQNPREVTAIHPAPPEFVASQMRTIAAELPPTAVKTGMLYSKEIILSVAEELKRMRRNRRFTYILDPVMVATSGAKLLKDDAVAAMRATLIPLADLVTPNLDEAAILAGFRPRDPEEMRRAARVIYDLFGVPVLVKGGHLEKLAEAIDLLYDGREEHLLTAPRIRRISTHGTGCTYSAAIAAFVAKGNTLLRAAVNAKSYLTGAITTSVAVAKHKALGW